jgi:uridine monophosphate synthetase
MNDLKLKRFFALKMFENNIIKFGSFKLKNGIRSPIYIDFRALRSNPELLGLASDLIFREITSKEISYDFVSDIPTSITPIVSVFSHKYGIPMVSPRVDKKNYGLGNKVDGSGYEGKTSILIDDVITDGFSKLEAITILEANKVNVEDILVFVDRHQGGRREIEKLGYNIYPIFSLVHILSLYLSENKISRHQYKEVVDYLKEFEK